MMKPIRTYGVKVLGFPTALYSARSPAKARAAAWRDYIICEDVSFKRFLILSSISRQPDPAGVGARVLIGGEPATTVYGHSSQYVWFMRDDSNMRLCSHPLDVLPLMTTTDPRP